MSHDAIAYATYAGYDATRYSYDANGRLIETQRPNGTVQTRSYDAKGQLLQLKDVDALGNVIVQYDFTFDAGGDITEEKSLPTPNAFGLANAEMAYTDYNRLMTVNGLSPTFDLDGNMTQGMLGGALETFNFDSRNRLTQAGSTSYLYDAENQRIGITESGQTTGFVVNSVPALSQVLVRTKPDGTQTYYVYGLGLIGEETNNNYRTYHYDLRGSTVALSDTSGAVTERFQYSAYGVLVAGDITKTPFLFNGLYGVMTDSNRLYHMRARFYNPEIRRFLNRDVLLGGISDGQSLNRFAYVEGNPISLIDPFGLEAVIIFVTQPHRDEKLNAWIQAARFAKDKAIQDLSSKYDNLYVLFSRVNTVSDVNYMLQKTPDIVKIIFIGHAGQNAIFVGSENASGTNISANMSGKNNEHPATLDWSNLSRKGSIEIWGCEAGMGNMPIAQIFANVTGVTVKAPIESLNFDEETGYPFVRVRRLIKALIKGETFESVYSDMGWKEFYPILFPNK